MSYRDIFDNAGTSFSLYPKPFAGKYPTRIHLWTNRRGEFDYKGKPSVAVFQKFRRDVLLKAMGTINFTEIDQNGCVVIMLGGSPPHPNPFQSAYYPVPRIVWECDARFRMYVMFNRKIVRVGKKQMWVMPDLFDKKKPWLPYVAMVEDCAKGRLKGNWLTDLQERQFIELIQPKVSEYFKKPKIAAAPEVLEAAFLEPQQVPTWNPPAWMGEQAQAMAAPPPPPDMRAVAQRIIDLQQIQQAAAQLGTQARWEQRLVNDWAEAGR